MLWSMRTNMLEITEESIQNKLIHMKEQMHQNADTDMTPMVLTILVINKLEIIINVKSQARHNRYIMFWYLKANNPVLKKTHSISPFTKTKFIDLTHYVPN